MFRNIWWTAPPGFYYRKVERCEREKKKKPNLLSSPMFFFFYFPGPDFQGVALFGVVTNKQVAEVISLTDDESVYLSRRLNSSLVSRPFMKEGPRIQVQFLTAVIGFINVHPHLDTLVQIFPRGELNFTSESICNWVFEHHEDVLQWLQPPGTKSRLLERELNKGPALLLFLPHNPLGSTSNPVLQQVIRAGGNRSRAQRHHTLGRSSSEASGQ